MPSTLQTLRIMPTRTPRAARRKTPALARSPVRMAHPGKFSLAGVSPSDFCANQCNPLALHRQMRCQFAQGVMHALKDSSDEIQQKTFSCRVDGSGNYAGNFRLSTECRIKTAARSKFGAYKTVWRTALLGYLGCA